MLTSLEKECLNYFKRPGFHRLLQEVKTKYRSLGHIGGTIVLKQLDENEKRDLNGFLRKDLSSTRDLRIGVKKLEQLLQDSKFASISLLYLLELYFGEEINSKKHERHQQMHQQEQFFYKIITAYQGSKGALWLQDVQQHPNGIYRSMVQRYKSDQQQLECMLHNIMKALNHLPIYTNTYLRLPIFASRMTQDPHYFDEKNDALRYLLHGICFGLHLPYPSNMNAQQRMEVLYEAGIQKDDISNYTTIFHMYAKNHNMKCQGWRAFSDANQPLQLNLMNLNDITSIQARSHIFVVENPSVFSTLVELCIEHDIKNVSLMCTYGQLRIASFMILDLLVKNNQSFYYAGDFDPEGLQIAQNLKKRYHKFCKLWHYEKEVFATAKSQNILTSQRMNKLESITEKELQEIKECIFHTQCCGYQEMLLNRYKKDLLDCGCK